MKQKILTMILVVIMIIGIPTTASGQGVGDMNQAQEQNQEQLQIHKQTEIDPELQEQERLQLRARLEVLSSAAIQQQERTQIQNQNQQCFSDIEQHWAQAEIKSAYNWGVVNGYPNGEYNPDNSITGPEGVAMMTKLMNNLEGIDVGETTPGAINWEGMPEWAKAQLQEQNALRIMTQTAYYNEENLNRLQFCVIFAKSLGLEPSEVPEDTISFLDQELIPQAELGYIHRLRLLGIIEGHEGNFHPDRPVTRAEAACILLRVMDVVE